MSASPRYRRSLADRRCRDRPGRCAEPISPDYSDVVYRVGDEVADYVIDRFLGSGSSADVYRAHHAGEPGPVALKVLHTRPSDQQRVRERFEREFTIASLLDHPHIVEMYARGEIDDEEYRRRRDELT